MPTKKKPVEEVKPVAATPEDIAAAREQAKANATEEAAPVAVKATRKVTPATPVVAPKTTEVIFKSIDGRTLQVGVGKEFFQGKTIYVPAEYADEVERLLTEGHYLITRIN